MSPFDLTRPLLFLFTATFALVTFEFIGDENSILLQIALAVIGAGLMFEGRRNSNRMFRQTDRTTRSESSPSRSLQSNTKVARA